MSWVEVAGFLFKLVGEIIDLKQKNELSRDSLNLAIAALKIPPPPKGD